MKEKLLQFIWQHQYFNTLQLRTSCEKNLKILFPGEWNQNQGADFLDAKVRIDETIWAGNVEIHTFSSDWNLHHHSKDANFGNVILHVVWRHDTQITGVNGDILPTLELESIIPNMLLNKYEILMNASDLIPCGKQFKAVQEFLLVNWKEKLILQRLQRKSLLIHKFSIENNFHWEETFWWLIARNFGATVNADCFENIARSIPGNILAKHKHQVIHLEAILFGQARLLDKNFTEAYPRMLQKEFKFFKEKYKFSSLSLQLFFLRMRPANFPSVRLAQLAMLLKECNHLFSFVRESENLKDVMTMLDVTANDYWHYHYRFDEPNTYQPKKVGNQMVGSIMINTVIPTLFAYGSHLHEDAFVEKALSWLQQLSPENNAVTRHFKTIGFNNHHASDSQSLIELKQQYCDMKRCLDCDLGRSILKLE